MPQAATSKNLDYCNHVATHANAIMWQTRSGFVAFVSACLSATDLWQSLRLCRPGAKSRGCAKTGPRDSIRSIGRAWAVACPFSSIKTLSTGIHDFSRTNLKNRNPHFEIHPKTGDTPKSTLQSSSWFDFKIDLTEWNGRQPMPVLCST